MGFLVYIRLPYPFYTVVSLQVLVKRNEIRSISIPVTEILLTSMPLVSGKLDWLEKELAEGPIITDAAHRSDQMAPNL